MDPSPHAAEETGRPSALRELAQTILRYTEARLRLAEIESREAGSRIGSIIFFTILSAGSLLTAWLIAAPALIWLISQQTGWHWHQVALIAAALHLLAALFCLAVLKFKLRRMRLFEETLRQFQKDRACLAPKN